MSYRVKIGININIWNDKIDEWINGLIGTQKFLNKAKNGEILSYELRKNLWYEFERIVNEFNEKFLKILNQVDYNKIEKIIRLMKIVNDDLIKYAKINLR